MRKAGFHSILCPVDFSDLSSHALRHAAVLAGCDASTLVAVHATWFEAPPYFTQARIDDLRRQYSDALEEASGSLDSFVDSALNGAGVPHVETSVVEGMPADVVRELTRTIQADLVVMGTHGRTGINRWMLGSVAERVLRESPIPVLTVRAAPRGPLREILCPVVNTDLSRQALRIATDLARCFDATVTVLHVQDRDVTAPVADLCSWIEREDRARCNIREMIQTGNAAEQIIATAAGESSGLLVLGAPRRPFFEGMVLGSTTLRVVRHAPCPVLSVGASEGDSI